MNKVARYLLLAYVFTMPFVSAFALTGTISIPLLLATLLFILMVLKILVSRELPKNLIGVDLIIIIFLLFIALFSFIVHGLSSGKSFNHTIAYLSSFILFYITIKYFLFELKVGQNLLNRIIVTIAYLTVLSALFANVEFILANFLSINLNNYIPRAIENERSYSPVVIELFIRSRGFESESGHFSFMMELFSPLTFYYLFFSNLCTWKLPLKILSAILIFSSFIFSASSAFFIIVPIALIISSLLKLKKVSAFIFRNKYKTIVVISITSAFLITVNYFLSFFSYIFLSLADKLDSTSFDDRQERMDFFFGTFSKFDFIEKLIGAGPAGFDILGFDDSKSILSLYYSITFELGFIGFFLLCLLFAYAFFQTIQIKGKLGFFLSISIISGIMHYYFIANFWYPWFWFIIVFSLFVRQRLNE